MKKMIIVTAATAIGLATYFLLKRRRSNSPNLETKTHHLTDAFARAKEYAIEH